MRISTSWAQQLGVNAMNAQQVKMSKTQMQLSAGLTNLTPSDDPAAAVKALSLQESIDKTTQYQENIEVTRARLSIEEGGLQTAENVIFRAKELTVQALNSTLTLQDREAIKSEIDQLLQEMVGVANTKNANGEYIFSGDLSTTPAVAWDAEVGSYVYQGGVNQRVLDIAPERRVADGDLGSNIFSNITSVSQEANTTVNGVEINQRSVFDTLQSLSKALSQEYEVPEAALTGDRFVRFGMDYSTPLTDPITPSLETTFTLTSDVGRTIEGSSPIEFPLNYDIATGGENEAFDLKVTYTDADTGSLVDTTETITLASDYADQNALVDDIQAQINSSTLSGFVEVDATANPLQFKTISTEANPILEIFESAAVTATPTNEDAVTDMVFSNLQAGVFTLGGGSTLAFPALDYSGANSNAVFDLVVDGNTETITLTGSYDNIGDLQADIQLQIDDPGSSISGLVDMSSSANPIEFKYDGDASNPRLSIAQSSAYSFGTNIDFTDAAEANFTSLQGNLQGVPILTANSATDFTSPLNYDIALGGKNAVFDLVIDGITESITLTGSYSDANQLTLAIQAEINLLPAISMLVDVSIGENPVQFNYIGGATNPSMSIVQNTTALAPKNFLSSSGFTEGDIAQPVTVTLNQDYADLDAVVKAINSDSALSDINIEARSNGNQIEFVSTTEGKDSSVSIYKGTGTFLTDFGFATGSTGKGIDLGGSISGKNTLTFSTPLDYSVTSAVFELADESGNSQIITLDASYADHASLVKAIQDQINGSPIEGKIEVDPSANPITFKSISSGTSAAVQINQVSGDFLKDNGFTSGDTGRVFSKTGNDVLADLDTALDNFLRVRTTVGARMHALDDQENQNEKFIVDIQTTLSNVQDLDYAEAISRFNLEQTALEAAQQAYSRVQNLSLFNFL